jgi:uncharacterized lipoprotein YehR (DUF1307 family)
MMKLIARLTTIILALLLALPIVGCQQKDKQTNDNGKGLDLQIDAGNTKVKVEGSKKPNEKGRHIDVDVDHPAGHEHVSGDRDK